MIQGRRVALTQAEAVVIAAESDAQYATVRNAGAEPAFLGPPGVAATTGYELKSTDAPLNLRLGPEDALNGICATGKTATLHVLETAST